MKTMRGFFAVLLGILFMLAAAEALLALDERESAIKAIEATLGVVAMAVILSAAYIGSVIEEHFTRIWPEQKPIEPSAQQPPQGEQR